MRTLTRGDETDLLEPYLRVDRSTPQGPCWVLANMVGGLDGSASIGGRVGVLSAGSDSVLFRRLRSVADVVLVGAETVRRERYGPAVLPDEDRARREAEGRTPVPTVAVVSRSLDLDWDSPLFRGAEVPTLVVTCTSAPPDRLEVARAAADVIVAGDLGVDVRAALDVLRDRGAAVVLTEGGPSLLGEIVAADLLDEYCLTIAPVMGGDALPLAVVPDGSGLHRFRLAATLVDDDTLFLRYQRGAA